MSEPDADMDNADGTQGQIEGNDEGSEASPYSGKSAEELTSMLQAAEAESAKSKDQYDNYRSMSDRKFGEMNNKFSNLEGKLSMVAEKDTDESQSKFDEEWAEKINENPAAAMDFFRGAMGDFMNKVYEKVEEKVNGVSSKVESIDPSYLAHKEDVDRLMSEDGLTRPQALKIAKRYAPKVQSPPRGQIPEGINSNGTKQSAVVSTFNPGYGTDDVFKNLGLDKEEILKEVMADMTEVK